MELAIAYTYQSPLVEEFLSRLADQNLLHYASDAAAEMEFEGMDEYNGAVKRAMELCLHAGIPVEQNFKRIYKSSINGIIYDWKLSTLAYRLVCLNGSSANPVVAQLQIRLIKDEAEYACGE
ncbi:MAG TPA: hypothetical protein VGO45_10015 [Bacteroidia bacterium]|nr:hypothetical protein [Bacteroidia bacterium]